MKKIIIAGTTGSGKTTLARKIAVALGCEFFDLDDFHWLPGWQERDKEEFFRLIEEAVQKPRWVMSGNYGKAKPVTWAVADTVIWLDYSFPRVFWQLLRRSVLRIRDKHLICNGNTETLGKFLSRDSIMIWLFQSYWRRKRDMLAVLDNPGAYPHITFLRFRTPKETEKWLISLTRSPSKN